MHRISGVNHVRFSGQNVTPAREKPVQVSQYNQMLNALAFPLVMLKQFPRLVVLGLLASQSQQPVAASGSSVQMIEDFESYVVGQPLQGQPAINPYTEWSGGTACGPYIFESDLGGKALHSGSCFWGQHTSRPTSFGFQPTDTEFHVSFLSRINQLGGNTCSVVALDDHYRYAIHFGQCWGGIRLGSTSFEPYLPLGKWYEIRASVQSGAVSMFYREHRAEYQHWIAVPDIQSRQCDNGDTCILPADLTKLTYLHFGTDTVSTDGGQIDDVVLIRGSDYSGFDAVRYGNFTPIVSPTPSPSNAPSNEPSKLPTPAPTNEPSNEPSKLPTPAPTEGSCYAWPKAVDLTLPQSSTVSVEPGLFGLNDMSNYKFELKNGDGSPLLKGSHFNFDDQKNELAITNCPAGNYKLVLVATDTTTGKTIPLILAINIEGNNQPWALWKDSHVMSGIYGSVATLGAVACLGALYRFYSNTIGRQVPNPNHAGPAAVGQDADVELAQVVPTAPPKDRI
ncbi:hypothetical protein EB093_04665 [bacterium]|nr:hypothetical protein [bacterium]